MNPLQTVYTHIAVEPLRDAATQNKASKVACTSVDCCKIPLKSAKISSSANPDNQPQEKTYTHAALEPLSAAAFQNMASKVAFTRVESYKIPLKLSEVSPSANPDNQLLRKNPQLKSYTHSALETLSNTPFQNMASKIACSRVDSHKIALKVSEVSRSANSDNQPLLKNPQPKTYTHTALEPLSFASTHNKATKFACTRVDSNKIPLKFAQISRSASPDNQLIYKNPQKKTHTHGVLKPLSVAAFRNMAAKVACTRVESYKMSLKLSEVTRSENTGNQLLLKNPQQKPYTFVALEPLSDAAIQKKSFKVTSTRYGSQKTPLKIANASGSTHSNKDPVFKKPQVKVQNVMVSNDHLENKACKVIIQRYKGNQVPLKSKKVLHCTHPGKESMVRESLQQTTQHIHAPNIIAGMENGAVVAFSVCKMEDEELSSFAASDLHIAYKGNEGIFNPKDDRHKYFATFQKFVDDDCGLWEPPKETKSQ